MTDWTYIQWRTTRAMPLFLLAFAPLCLGGVWLADKVPLRFKSTAVIMLEQAPGDTQTARVRPGEAAPERLRVMAQKVTAYDRFSALKTTFGDHNSQVSTKVTAGREKATLLTLEATAMTAQTSYDIATHLVTALQEDYAASLRGRMRDGDTKASALVDSLTESVASLTDRLNLAKGVVALFPQGASSTLTAQLRRLDEQERAATTRRSDTSTLPERTRLEADLNRALSVYSREHPKVKLILGQMNALPDDTAEQAEPIDLNALQAKRLQLADRLERITAAKAELAGLRTDHAQALRDLAQARRDLDRRNRQSQTRFDQDIQLLSILTPPALPQSPAMPSPGLLKILAIIAAALLAGGVAALRQRLDRVVHRATDLERHLGITPFAILPAHDPLTP